MRIVCVMLAALALAGPAWSQEEQPRVIIVSGEGRAEAIPDMASLRLGVVTEAEVAGEAIAANSEAMAQVLDRLTGLGIADRDLQTSSFSVSPRYSDSSNGGRREIVGYAVSNLLTVRVRDLGRLGEVMDAVAQDGANRFDGLSFGLQDPDKALEQARLLAVADGRAKAELFAEAAAVSLGELLTLSEAGATPRPLSMARAEMAMDSAPVPIAQGEIEVSASVTLTYAIE